MSTGTNRERLEQNNLKLEEIKTQVSNLPEYQDIEPIYKTVGFSTKNKFSQSWADNSIVFFDNYSFIRGTYSAGRGNLYVYEGNELVCTSSLSPFVNTTNVNERKPMIIGYNKDKTKIYIGMPSSTTEYSNNFSIGYYDIINKKVQFVKTQYLPFSVYYAGSSDYTSNSNFHQLYYDRYLVLMNSSSSSSYRPNYLCYFDEETETINSILLIGEGTMVAPSYMLKPNSNVIVRVDMMTSTTATATNIKSDSIIDGVGYDGTFIFSDGNIYELTLAGTIGNLIAENVYERQDGYVIKALNDMYYFYNRSLYKFQDNKFEEVQTSLSFYGNTLYNTSNAASVQTYNFNTTETLIGIIYDKYKYLFPNDAKLNSNVVLNGNLVYSSDGTQYVGTMPNNGKLNYTPSTEVQTIPTGYTSGGTISAIDASIDENIVAENIKSGVTILGVTGTFEATTEVQEQVETLTQENEVLTTTVDESNAIAEDILGTNT